MRQFTILIYLQSRLRELSFLNKGIKLSLTDRRREDEEGNFVKDKFISENGLIDFVNLIDENREKLLDSVIHMDTEKNGVPVEIAMHYNTSFSENIHSMLITSILMRGTHLSGFRRALTRTLKRYADESGMLDKVKFEIAGDDFREGLTAVISVKVMEPQFEGQTKTKLGNKEVTGAVDQAVGEMLTNYLEENPNMAKQIVQKVLLAAQARNAARKAREMVQRKNVLSGSGLPGKLADCSNKDPEKCEIFPS